jgi:tripartite-type tricarboxylate transporter receptor subunit TctC
MNARTTLHIGCALALLPALTSTWPAAAQPARPAADYPRKPIRLIVPFAPGGNTDFLARLVGQKLGESWGQQVIADNRPGAGGSVAGEMTARAAPDGYTLLMISITNSIAATLHPGLPYDVVRDFAPLVLLATTPQVLLAHPSLPVKSVRELVAFARARPGKLSYASAGTGGGTHLTGELLKQVAGLDIVHVPYRGGGPALIDLVAGQVDLQITGLVSALPFIKSKRANPLAVTGARRSPAAPDIVSMAESGLPEVDANSWYGLVAPAATPREIIAQLNGEIARILAVPDLRARLAADGAEAGGGTPEQFGAYIKSEIAKWARVIRLANIRAQ